MKLCPSCNCKCANEMNYCPKCNRYLGSVNSISEEEYYKVQDNIGVFKSNSTVTCPYCHSTSVKKIDFLSRVGSAELWGLGSPEIGKNFKCNRCGAYF